MPSIELVILDALNRGINAVGNGNACTEVILAEPKARTDNGPAGIIPKHEMKMRAERETLIIDVGRSCRLGASFVTVDMQYFEDVSPRYDWPS